MIIGYVGLNIVLLLVLLWGRFELQKFLHSHPQICDGADMSAFKAIARRNMHAAAFILGFGITNILWSIQLGISQGLLGLAVVLTVNAPGFFLGQSTKELGQRARALPCTDPNLQAEYARVAVSWVKKLLPDF